MVNHFFNVLVLEFHQGASHEFIVLFGVAGCKFPEFDECFDLDRFGFEVVVFGEWQFKQFFSVIESRDFVDSVLDECIERLSFVVVGLCLFVVGKFLYFFEFFLDVGDRVLYFIFGYLKSFNKIFFSDLRLFFSFFQRKLNFVRPLVKVEKIF
jgi:hypothetical protein